MIWRDSPALPRHHPRQEPSAVVPLAGIRAGGGPSLIGQGLSLPRPVGRQITPSYATRFWVDYDAGYWKDVTAPVLKVIAVSDQHKRAIAPHIAWLGLDLGRDA
jgi:hypothetical protein